MTKNNFLSATYYKIILYAISKLYQLNRIPNNSIFQASNIQKIKTIQSFTFSIPNKT